MARPTKLTPVVQDRICQAIRLGATYELAARVGGVSADSLARYRRNAGFADHVKRAEGEAVVGWLANIGRAAADDWKAAAWLLERRYPHLYGQRASEIRGRPGPPIGLAVEPIVVTLKLGERDLARGDDADPPPLRRPEVVAGAAVAALLPATDPDGAD